MTTSPVKRVYIQGNILKKKLSQVVIKLTDLLREFKIETYFDREIATILPADFKGKLSEEQFGLPEDPVDLTFSLGGDGTVLRSLQKVLERNIPILPLNMGGLGFLTEISPDELDTRLREILTGNYRYDERAVLKTTVQSTGKVFYGLNDAVIDKAGFSRVIFINTRIDGQFFNSYLGDGLIVSTPTGSTGYSLSSGGPILMPNLDAFIINPICPHSLTNRPVVISARQTMEVTVFTDHDKAQLIVDGQQKSDLKSGEVLMMSMSEYRVKLIRHPDSHFFNILRNKLHWGEDLRTKERWAQNISSKL